MAAPAPSNAQNIGNFAAGDLVRLVCSADVVVQGDQQWMLILPAGPFIETRDGRAFHVSDMVRVAAACEKPMLLDWEHQSELGFMGSSRAAGWFEEFHVENAEAGGRMPAPGIWARCKFTPAGAADVKDMAFRFLSPVVLLDRTTNEAIGIASVALTNTPALHIPAIDAYRQRFSARFGGSQPGETTMDKETRLLLCVTLGLAGTATDADLAGAVKSAVGARELCAKLTTDLSASQAKVVELEAQLIERDTQVEAAKFSAEVKDCLDQATRDGKISPATRPGYEKMCTTREQFSAFKDHVLPNLASVGKPAPKSTNGPKTTPLSGDGSEVGVDREALKKRGMSEENIERAVKYRAESRAKFLAEQED